MFSITLFASVLASFLELSPWQKFLAHAQESGDYIEEEEFPTPSDSGEALISQDEDREEEALFLPSSPRSTTNRGRDGQFGAWDGRQYPAVKSQKPGFSFHLGAVRKEYGISILNTPKMGVELGLTLRLINIPHFPVSFLIGGGASIINLGQVRSGDERIIDVLYRFGAFMEFSLHRRFQILFGALHYMSRPVNIGTNADTTNDTIDRIRETRFSPGAGIQYEFHVIPYGSIGLRFWIEERVTALLLTFSMSPTPRSERSFGEED